MSDQRLSGVHSHKRSLPPARHETNDITFRPTLIAFALTTLAVIAIVLFPLWLFPRAAGDKTLTLPLPRFASPRLQSNPSADMQAFYDSKIRWLNSFGWVDKAQGIVHVPIDDAMRRIAEGGIADWPTGQEEDAR